MKKNNYHNYSRAENKQDTVIQLIKREKPNDTVQVAKEKGINRRKSDFRENELDLDCFWKKSQQDMLKKKVWF